MSNHDRQQQLVNQILQLLDAYKTLEGATFIEMTGIIETVKAIHLHNLNVFLQQQTQFQIDQIKKQQGLQ